jgi:hypothetical protein
MPIDNSTFTDFGGAVTDIATGPSRSGKGTSGTATAAAQTTDKKMAPTGAGAEVEDKCQASSDGSGEARQIASPTSRYLIRGQPLLSRSEFSPTRF